MRPSSKRQTASRAHAPLTSGRALLLCFAALLVAPCSLPLLAPRLGGARAAGNEVSPRPAGAGAPEGKAGASGAEDKLRAARRLAEEAEQLRAEWKEPSTRRAAEKYLLALAAFRAAGDGAEEAATLMRLGEVSLLLGEQHEAAAHFKRALDLYGAVGDLGGEARALNGVGSAYTFVGKNKEAIDLFRRALRLGRRGGDRVEQARSLGHLGEAYYNLSDMGRALDHLNQSLRLFDAASDPRGRAQALRYLGYVHTDTSELALALDYFKQSLPFWQQARDLRGEAQATNAIGLVNSLLGEREQAIEFYARAERLFREMGDREGLTTALNGQGELYAGLSLERALSCHEEALRLSEETGELEGQIISHSFLGHTHRALGEAARAAGREDRARESYERSLQHYRRSLDLSASLRDRRIEAYNLLDIGRAYDFLGDLAQALGHYGRALQLSRQARDPRGQAQVLNCIGYVHERAGRVTDALAHYRRALPLARAAQDQVREANTLFHIGRAERDRGDLRAASAHADAALRIVESLRAKVPGHAFRSSYFASVQSYFELSIGIHMRSHARDPSAGSDVKALEVSELARARSLLDMLSESRAEIRRGVAPELLDEERRLRQALGAKATRRMSLLSGEHTTAQAAAAEREIAELNSRYEEVEARIRKQSPRYAALAQPLGIGEIQRRVLDSRTVLLEYALGGERSYVWAVTRDRVAAYELPGRERIERSARALYELLTARQPAPGESAERRRERVARADADCLREIRTLSDMILGPVAGHLVEGRRLLVVADGALQYVPFGALTVPGADAHGVVGGEAMSAALIGDGAPAPVFTRHEVVNLPSASILPALQGEALERKPAERLVAVFADPVFEKDDPRVGGGGDRPASGTDEGARVHPVSRDVSAAFGRGIPRLMASRAEADAIAASLPRGEVSKLTDFGASRSAAVDPSLGRHSVVHFATHGILNSERPEMSGIVLSLLDERGRPQDGFLSFRDIHNLDLPVDLVVLSACNTALGKDTRGEGLVGVTRGFMYAGASSVVASLWKVDDEATAELMKHFYAGMFRRGLAPPAALREAQLEMWRQKRWRSPYYWAGFVIQGQYGELKGAPVKQRGGPFGLLTWGAGAAAISLAALYALGLPRRRVRKALRHAKP